MASEKATVVLVPGAWLPASGYDDLLKHLREAGFPAVSSDLLSLDPKDPELSTIELDAEHVKKNVLIPLIEDQGRDVVILTHSYGSQPGSAAGVGLTKSERTKQGQKGGVTGFIAFSGLTIPEGITCAQGNGGELQPWVLKDHPFKGLSTTQDPTSIFFNNMPEASATLAASELRPHAYRPFLEIQPKNVWADPDLDGRIGYIVTKDDQGLRPSDQKTIMQFTAREWIVSEVPGGHCTYIDRADVVAESVVDVIGRFRPFN